MFTCQPYFSKHYASRMQTNQSESTAEVNDDEENSTDYCEIGNFCIRISDNSVFFLFY